MIHESEFSIFRNHLNSFFSKYENPRQIGTSKSQPLHMADTVTDLDVLYIYIYIQGPFSGKPETFYQKSRVRPMSLCVWSAKAVT